MFSGDTFGPSDEGGESELEQELNPMLSKQDSTRELHETATALPPSFHHPNLKALILHEALLTKNFEGDQHFFKDGGHMEAHPSSPRPSYIESGVPLGATQVVPHEDAPAFSDIATTVMTTASPTSPGKLHSSIGQNRPSKRRIEGKVEVLGGQVIMTTSPLRTGQQRDSPKADRSPRVDFTKKGPRPARKSIMGNPTDMERDATITSIIHTTTVISTMREQGM